MKCLMGFLFAALGICSGCSKSPVLSPEQFTDEFAEALRKSSPGHKVEVVRDLELKVTTSDREERTCYLHNAYATYKRDPTEMVVVQKSFITALETVMAPRKSIEPTCIVPVIKDRLWLEEGLQTVLNSGAQDVPEYICDDLNEDLIVLYAEDLPGAMRFLVREDLDAARIERKQLRTLACENLKRLLPKIECHGSDGFYMITAGGTYEASLLLLNSIWTHEQMDVQGHIVVAIPTRDLLLVTGSGYPEGIDKVRQMAQQAYGEGAYRLTPKLFVYRDGCFTEFE